MGWFNHQLVPSLKLTLRPWKWGPPGKGDSYWKPPFLGVYVSFREGNDFFIVHFFGIGQWPFFLSLWEAVPSHWSVMGYFDGERLFVWEKGFQWDCTEIYSNYCTALFNDYLCCVYFIYSIVHYLERSSYSWSISKFSVSDSKLLRPRSKHVCSRWKNLWLTYFVHLHLHLHVTHVWLWITPINEFDNTFA